MVTIAFVHRWDNLHENIGCLPSLDACITPSGTMNDSPQRGDFQVRSISDTPGLVSEVHGAFSNRDLL